MTRSIFECLTFKGCGSSYLKKNIHVCRSETLFFISGIFYRQNMKKISALENEPFSRWKIFIKFQVSFIKKYVPFHFKMFPLKLDYLVFIVLEISLYVVVYDDISHLRTCKKLSRSGWWLIISIDWISLNNKPPCVDLGTNATVATHQAARM